MALYKQGFTADQYSWKPELRNNIRWDSSVELQKIVQLITRWYIGQTRKDRHNLGTIRPFLLHSKDLKWKAATQGQKKESKYVSCYQKYTKKIINDASRQFRQFPNSTLFIYEVQNPLLSANSMSRVATRSTKMAVIY